MSLGITEFDIGALACLCEDRVSDGQSCQRRGIKVRERVKRITLDVAAGGGGIEKACVKVGVVTH